MFRMPNFTDNRVCSVLKDTGSPADVEELRHDADGPLTPLVLVADDFAIVDWYGAGGGQRIYGVHHHQWFVIAGGGGAIGITDARLLGIPPALWCRLHIHDAQCSAARAQARSKH